MPLEGEAPSPWQNGFSGEDDVQILSFLRGLGFVPVEKDIPTVLEIWKTAWNSGLNPDELSFDLDHTTYDYSLMRLLLNRDRVVLRESVIGMVALALKNNKTIPIVTHTSRQRVLNLVNHPDLGLLRYAMFFKGPKDGVVTNDEVMDSRRIVTYEMLAGNEASILEKWRAGCLDASLLSLHEQAVCQSSIASWLESAKEFVRGQKTIPNIKLVSQIMASLHVDDSLSQVWMKQRSGSRVVHVPKKLKPSRIETDELLPYGARVFTGLVTLKNDGKPGNHEKIESRDIRPSIRMPVAVLKHPQFFKMVWQGWMQPSLKLISEKTKTCYALWGQGRLGQFMHPGPGFFRLR